MPLWLGPPRQAAVAKFNSPTRRMRWRRAPPTGRGRAPCALEVTERDTKRQQGYGGSPPIGVGIGLRATIEHMITREDLHRLVERLPESEFDAAQRFLEFLCIRRSMGFENFERPETPPGPE
jgi:hypothetical protein